jgi:hypothetical protein
MEAPVEAVEIKWRKEAHISTDAYSLSFPQKHCISFLSSKRIK